MNPTELNNDEINREGRLPRPNKQGYNSLYYHHLTSGNETSTLYGWGNELTRICNNQNIAYYYFYNDKGTKINVYPNDLIESWWNSKN